MERILSEKIVHQAMDLFNRQGVLSTSLRNIANEMGISDGHLRYYFKTKEEIIIAVYQEMLSRIQLMEEGLPKEIPLWKNIVLQIQGAFLVQRQFSWLYIESSFLFKKYPKLRTMHFQVKEMQKQHFTEENRLNRERGVFTPSLTDSMLNILQEQFLILIDSWILYHQNKSTKEGIEEKVVNHYVAVTIGSFFPYLNNTVQKDLEPWMKQNILCIEG